MPVKSFDELFSRMCAADPDLADEVRSEMPSMVSETMPIEELPEQEPTTI